jgi:hypothetical protein
MSTSRRQRIKFPPSALLAKISAMSMPPKFSKISGQAIRALRVPARRRVKTCIPRTAAGNVGVNRSLAK